MTVREYNTCVHTYADRIYRFILKSIRNEEAAGDIMQDTWEKVWLKVSEVPYEKARAYLFSTAYHTLIDYIRKNSRYTEMPEEQMESTYSTEYTGIREVLDQALNSLPEAQKTALLLRDYEGYSYKEIGEISGQSEAQVKINIYRARKALKKYIGTPEVLI